MDHVWQDAIACADTLGLPLLMRVSASRSLSPLRFTTSLKVNNYISFLHEQTDIIDFASFTVPQYSIQNVSIDTISTSLTCETYRIPLPSYSKLI